MCGIAGILNLNGKPVDLKILANMTAIIKHRGPDGNGIMLFDPKFSEGQNGIIEYKDQILKLEGTEDNHSNYNVGLAHARLSIIDLSERGHQPMCNRDESLGIVYNGEIYNYLEIKAELVSKGYEFKSKTDTEVILYAYQEWGVDCLTRFNGMWAFAIWNRREKRLFCARDRFGVKPFYYYLDEHTFVFAYEIKQILECKEYERNPNEPLIYDYLVMGFEDHTRETFFKNIYQLKGGEYAILDLNKRTFEKKRYYDLNGINKLVCKESDYYLRFRELFTDSVKLRLRSDVPVGSCLSGGLDSSAVVSIIATLWKEKERVLFNTFTACWDDKKIDERKYSEAIVESSGFSGNFIYPSSEDLTEDLASLLWHQEEPFGSLSIFAQWSVMKAAQKKGIKVLLDGQGGDEVFCGYERYYAYYLSALLKQFMLREFINEFIKGVENSKLKLSGMILYYIYFNCVHVRALRHHIKSYRILNPNFFMNYDILVRLKNGFKEANDLSELQRNEIQGVQLSHLLKYADRNSMAFSIETRLPFLDYRLVEFALSIPMGLLIHDGWTKNIVREGLKRIIPDEIRRRKDKIGFEVPQDLFIKHILENYFNDINENSLISTYFNKKWLLKDIKTISRKNPIIWKTLCLDLWFKVFFENAYNNFNQ